MFVRTFRCLTAATQKWEADVDCVLVGASGQQDGILSSDPSMDWSIWQNPLADEQLDGFFVELDGIQTSGMQLNIPIRKGQTIYLAPNGNDVPSSCQLFLELAFQLNGSQTNS